MSIETPDPKPGQPREPQQREDDDRDRKGEPKRRDDQPDLPEEEPV